MTKKAYRIPPGLGLMAGTILEPERPTSEDLKKLIIGMAINDDEEDPNGDALRGLVSAYTELLIEEEEDLELVSDSNDWAAEKVCRECAIRGWRDAVKAAYPDVAKSRDDSEVYECCPWYEFGKMTWPVQLVAEVGYLAGYREGRRALRFADYAKHQEIKYGKDWWKEA